MPGEKTSPRKQDTSHSVTHSNEKKEAEGVSGPRKSNIPPTAYDGEKFPVTKWSDFSWEIPASCNQCGKCLLRQTGDIKYKRGDAKGKLFGYKQRADNLDR
ncbi:hypothetical protein NPIL_414191 [Nephila pilipes]|uniref:Uncharacterized protein n=1 Tax=Nephila pilipes TaxID=299642 RepID=A0A8X6R1F3_NEPPI|nr:hypothetical protein NPIL_414191 [Nephila pilipes]